jgi:DNA-binding transcriptional regulator YhcF (GntR family)
MSRSTTQIEPPLHRDVYPVVRVSTEFFLRSFDLLGQLHDDTVSALIIMTLWHGTLAGVRRRPMSIRELSRKLDLPYETVRRHVRELVASGACRAENGGLVVPWAVQPDARASEMLRKIYLNAQRMLGDLTRIEVVDFKLARPPLSRSRRMGKEQVVIAVAAIGLLLSAMRTLRGFFDGDLVKGLVFTGIRAANVKHVTNTAPAAHRSILPDIHRLPVSVLAISASMRLPYETVRRHADSLLKEGKCIRVGRRGLMVPESAFRDMTVESVTVRQLILAFLAELRAAGVKV